MRKSLSTLAAVAALTLAGLAGSANAASYTVTPADLATGKLGFVPDHGSGTNPFAYDWDSAAPGTAAGAPPGAGSTSFSANVSQSGATQADRYRTFRLSPEALAGGSSNTDFSSGNFLTINDLVAFSYQNLQNSGANAWRVTIYTTPGDVASDPNDTGTGAGDTASWYRSRIQLNPTSPGSGWQTISSSSASASFTENNPNFSLAGTNWAAVRAAFGTERIMMIDFTLGANSGGGTQAAQLDNIVFNYANGESDHINLEATAVPIPAALPAGLLLLSGLTLRRRNRLHA